MKNFVLGIVFTVVVLFFGGIAYLLLGYAEVRGDLAPSWIESALMRRAVHASAWPAAVGNVREWIVGLG